MTDIIIVGGGLTGLVCARALKEQGYDFLLLESQAELGGRVQTDQQDGYLLDRGFQVFLTAYPEARRWLDYDALNLSAFYPGASIHTHRGNILLGDPLRQPEDALITALARLGTIEDKLQILKLRSDLQNQSLEQLATHSDRPSALYLRELGFSEAFIQAFFQPFLAGIFLDPTLQTSSHNFHFVMKMFSEGSATVPAGGMQSIPRQLAQWLPTENIRLNSPVTEVQPGKVRLHSGEQLSAKAVVVATQRNAAEKLLRLPPRRSSASRTLYFSCAQTPIDKPVLMLNGRGNGPVNNLTVISLAAPSYAPKGKHLLALTILMPWAEQSLTNLLSAVKKQMLDWVGESSHDWEFIKDYWLPHSLPEQAPPGLSPISRTRRLESGLYLGGDFTEIASINGAMKAGRILAELVQKDL